MESVCASVVSTKAGLSLSGCLLAWRFTRSCCLSAAAVGFWESLKSFQ